MILWKCTSKTNNAGNIQVSQQDIAVSQQNNNICSASITNIIDYTTAFECYGILPIEVGLLD